MPTWDTQTTMLPTNRRTFRAAFIEQLENRIVLDSSGMACGVEFADSDLVTNEPDGTLRFASLHVGEVDLNGQPTILDDSEVVDVRSNLLSVGEIKNLLHGFADSIGTTLFAETNDIRFSPWGTGAGSTTNRFEAFIEDHLASAQPCVGLRFDGDVQFDLPGEGGEFFTGGFLELRQNGFSTLLRSGDIAEIVESYEITSDGDVKTLTVNALLGEAKFTINTDQTLTDEFGQTWFPKAAYQLADPNAVDQVMGDINGSGKVDFADFLILSNNFGQETAEGDLDCDGSVGFSDFLILSGNFGEATE